MSITIIQVSPAAVSAIAAAIASSFSQDSAAAAPAPADSRTGFESGDGIVIDHGTGLMWSASTLPNSMSWDDASKAAAAFTLGGFSDWRLPTVKELQSLVDYERREPAIDTTFFPDTKSDRYWSSTPVVGWPACAWFVYFYDGYVLSLDRGFEGFVRPVRSARPRQ